MANELALEVSLFYRPIHGPRYTVAERRIILAGQSNGISV